MVSLLLMSIVRKTTRNGQRGSIVQVAPKEGYERFVPDEYDKPRRGRRGR